MREMQPLAQAKRAAQSFVENVEFITPAHSYHDNTAFGGQIFAWMDNAVAISAMRHCGHKAVTASVDALYFIRPVNLGFIVNVEARLIGTFKTSCMVRSVVTAYPPRSDSRQLIAAGFFSMVAVDETGKPKNIPALLIESDEEWELENISRELREGRPRQRERLLSHLNFEGT